MVELPDWAHAPLVFLGLAFIVNAPFVAPLIGVSRWFIYVGVLVVALVYGLWARGQTRVEVIERTDTSITYRVQYTKRIQADPSTSAEEDR